MNPRVASSRRAAIQATLLAGLPLPAALRADEHRRGAPAQVGIRGARLGCRVSPSTSAGTSADPSTAPARCPVFWIRSTADLRPARRIRLPARRVGVPGHRPRMVARQHAARGVDRRLARLRSARRPCRRGSHRRPHARAAGLLPNGITELSLQQTMGTAHPSASATWSGNATDASVLAGGLIFGPLACRCRPTRADARQGLPPWTAADRQDRTRHRRQPWNPPGHRARSCTREPPVGPVRSTWSTRRDHDRLKPQTPCRRPLLLGRRRHRPGQRRCDRRGRAGLHRLHRRGRLVGRGGRPRLRARLGRSPRPPPARASGPRRRSRTCARRRRRRRALAGRRRHRRRRGVGVVITAYFLLGGVLFSTLGWRSQTADDHSPRPISADDAAAQSRDALMKRTAGMSLHRRRPDSQPSREGW
jgi:hypothetical protein